MNLLIGILLIFAGICVIRYAVQHFTEDPIDAVIDHLWDYLNNRMMAIVFGIALTGWGAVMVLTVLRPDLSIHARGDFPFVEIKRNSTLPNRPEK